ncbi:hypothetical protein [Nocardia farcinica]|uniref:hypothetical protein n=1 Tax=Nocardia farcinica TaxID=37329 RepID=UPI00245725F0|nr:hypothetical protein [Nocardia farcinica]
MDGESFTRSPEWTGTIKTDPASHEAWYRGSDGRYRTRTLWAVLDEVVQGRLIVNVFEDQRMVELDNVETDPRHGDLDARLRGAGRALMDRLEQLYPAPQWWFAADPRASHSDEGERLMRSRCRAGRQWVHSKDCPDRLPVDCPCNPPWLSHTATGRRTS